MALTKKEFSDYIKQFNFRELFNDMGWNNDKTKQPIVVDNETYTLQAVGEKSGFKIMLCNPQPNGLLPDYNTRKKIETKVTKLFQEHLIIFFDTKNTEQIWQLVVRQSGKPTKVTETRWHINQDPELLYQRAAGIFFELDEEDKITIVDVKKRIGENFQQNNEKVTKQFYDKFKKEHGSFLQFIKGISDKANQDWYASLMLNRLMFCYFIQKKGFLDNNKNYLRDKLKACKEKKGKVKFYSFYRDFLLVLFHKGLNEPTQNQEVKIEIGKIPYLNGGLFDEHELEKTHTSIEIDDKAFERLFDFFDQYEWHLDTSVTATGKDINPDVIGYIFEKYINDRANMGAYYTKEDITDYISKNCILPYLFEETKRNYPKGFNADAELWQMVKTSGDEYVYDAVKKGVEEPLPKEIEQGIKEVSKRNEWNKPATINYALPTEIWREVVDRRNRYTEVITKIDKGEINTINDFITHNLNIRQFAQDTVENTNDPELLKHFYKALNSVTIIDPTCGSGAFLFAAMNILEPLYESCIQRMENFVAEAPKGKYKYFEEVLAQVKSPEHPNLQYFIYKSIILRNLYGVDIMKEAVEIAKLRLFLKLVATVEADYRKPNLGLEPLPDIDFNIRAGNTLIGFATEEEYKKGLLWSLDFENDDDTLKEKMEQVSMAFKEFKKIQLDFYSIEDKKNKVGEWSYASFKNAKNDLTDRIKELNNSLNSFLSRNYGVDAKKVKELEIWKTNFQPFHWFAEFFEIIHDKGGFDVVIGNPPYVEYSATKFPYKIEEKLFKTFPSRNLYSLVFERAKLVLKSGSRIGMIVQISSVSTPSMETMVKEIKRNVSTNWLSNFATRPAYLFEGVTMNLTIIISEILKLDKPVAPVIYASPYLRWKPECREQLFQNIPLNKVDNDKFLFEYSIPKLKNEKENLILGKLITQKKTLSHYLEPTKNSTKQELFYRTAGGRYFKVFIDRAFGSESKSNKSKYFQNKYNVNVMIAVLSSDIWWWYYTLHFDMYNCKDYMMYSFPFDYDNCKYISELEQLGEKLSADMIENAEKKMQSYATTGERMQLIFRPTLSKPIIEDIDRVLAKHYNLNEEQIDYIVTYDNKYRLTKEAEEDEE